MNRTQNMRVRSEKIKGLLADLRQARIREAAELKGQKIYAAKKEKEFQAMLKKQFGRIDLLEKKLNSIVAKNKLRK